MKDYEVHNNYALSYNDCYTFPQMLNITVNILWLDLQKPGISAQITHV